MWLCHVHMGYPFSHAKQNKRKAKKNPALSPDTIAGLL